MGWVILVLFVVIAGIGLIVTGTLSGKARELESFIKGMTLPMTDTALTMIPRRLFRANVGAFIGGGPMVVVMIVMGFTSPHSLGMSSISVIGLLMLAGLTLGIAIACTTNIGPSTPELPRVARATQPRMSDYLSPVWVATGVTVCVAGLVAALLVLPKNTANGWMNSLLVALIVVNAVTLAASPWLAHRLLASPQPANDSLQLAWDDALRAHALRSVWLVPFAVGIATTMLALNLLYSEVQELGYLEYVLLFVVLRASTRLTRPGSRFQHRLWPRTPQPVVDSYAE